MKLYEYYPYIDMLVNDFKKKHNIDSSVRISWKINKDKLKKPKFFIISIESEGLSMTNSFECNILDTDFQFYTGYKISEELDCLYKEFLNMKIK